MDTNFAVMLKNGWDLAVLIAKISGVNIKISVLKPNPLRQSNKSEPPCPKKLPKVVKSPNPVMQ